MSYENFRIMPDNNTLLCIMPEINTAKYEIYEILETFRTLPVSVRHYAERRNKMRHYE